MDFIYARQSVDKKDSISIESQIELCQREVVSNDYEVFKDKGYSGKNTDRPDFQKMMSQIRKGGVERVIVYKLDRVSRSVLDFASLIEEFQKYNVEFVSVTEKFDTATPIGKAMLMIIMIFAQLERETIQQRVADAYKSRSRKGLYMGGKIPYGFRLKETVIDGVRTNMYESVPEEVEIVKRVFDMCQDNKVSLAKIASQLDLEGYKKRDVVFTKDNIRDMILNPIYVKADGAVYNFYSSHGAEMVDDISMYAGTNGVYLYSITKKCQRKSSDVSDCVAVLAPSEGIIDSSLWLTCRQRCSTNPSIPRIREIKHTWLAGKLKCKKCGYAMVVRRFPETRQKDNYTRYYACSRHAKNYTACEGVGCIYAEPLEDIIFLEIKNKLKDIPTLRHFEEPKPNIELEKKKARIIEINKEIDDLLNKVAGANITVMKYINNKVTELDSEKVNLQKEITNMSYNEKIKLDSKEITNYMDKWDELSIQDKRDVVDALIERIEVDKESVDIYWRF